MSTICHRTTKFDVVTRGGGACIFGSTTPAIPRQRSSRAPQLLVVLLYYAYTPFNAERLNSAW